MKTGEEIFKKFNHFYIVLDSSPNGLSVRINFGNKVNTEIIANNIAIPVKIPK